MAIERVVSSLDQGDDTDIVLELTLRPHDFANYIGQKRLKQNLQLAIEAAKKKE